MKPIKRSYKLWCLADNDGYIYEFDVYVGKDINGNQMKEYGLGGDVAISLTDHLENKNDRIYFDNIFSSFSLCEYLQAYRIFACRTIRSNKKDLPKLDADKQMVRGNFDFRSTSSGTNGWTAKLFVVFGSTE